MKFYVIDNPEKKHVAVVFHDYSTSEFIVRSSHESFRRAFDAGVQGFFGNTYRKDGDKLYLTPFGPEFPIWMKQVLDKVCSNYWVVSESGDLPLKESVDSIVSNFL
ncbi:MAG TPA: hypothetical protein VMW09_01540 [Desulfatiglandales bacterium]|nr:hypothetical protein [Desulfatiglandales bacterium]